MESDNIGLEIRTIRIELEVIKKELELSFSELRNNYNKESLQKGLTIEIVRSIDNLLSAIGDKQNEPIAIFQKAYGFLNEMEQIEFIARNVMEALKRGESPSKIATTYRSIGILEKSGNGLNRESDFKEDLTEFWFNLNFKTIKSLGTLATRLASKSLKKIPEFFKIKTHFSPIPPFLSFSCEVGESTGMDKLLEVIQDSIKETNTVIARRKVSK